MTLSAKDHRERQRRLGDGARQDISQPVDNESRSGGYREQWLTFVKEAEDSIECKTQSETPVTIHVAKPLWLQKSKFATNFPDVTGVFQNDQANEVVVTQKSGAKNPLVETWGVRPTFVVDQPILAGTPVAGMDVVRKVPGESEGDPDEEVPVTWIYVAPLPRRWYEL